MKSTVFTCVLALALLLVACDNSAKQRALEMRDMRLHLEARSQNVQDGVPIDTSAIDIARFEILPDYTDPEARGPVMRSVKEYGGKRLVGYDDARVLDE